MYSIKLARGARPPQPAGRLHNPGCCRLAADPVSLSVADTGDADVVWACGSSAVRGQAQGTAAAVGELGWQAYRGVRSR